MKIHGGEVILMMVVAGVCCQIKIVSLSRGVQPYPEPNPPAQTVQSGSRIGRLDVGDESAAGLYSLNLKTTGRLAGLRLRNRYLTDPIVSDQKIAHFLSDLLRFGLNSKENYPFSVRFIENWPKLKESGKIMSRFGQVSPDPATFGKIRQIFAQPETDRGLI